MEKLDRMLLTIGRGKVYNRIIAETEKELIEAALMKAFGNQSIASKILGINRNTMRAKIRKLNIDPANFRI
ncbi:MAG: helix-turn-helix domain-containing protein [Candidatus Omnitrophota bacterium]